jgi:hypothetical protein
MSVVLALVVLLWLQSFALGTMIKVGPDHSDTDGGLELGATGAHRFCWGSRKPAGVLV